MGTQPELVAPITVDLRAPDLDFDIIKGIEHVNYKDEALVVQTLNVGPGDWMVTSSAGLVAPTSGTAVANTYPVCVGNNQFDAIATGDLTIIVGGGYLYQTNKFVVGSYTVGQSLTVKTLNAAGTGVLGAASGSDPILARVYAFDSVNGVMQVQVLDR
jgi:hypothetical protein